MSDEYNVYVDSRVWESMKADLAKATDLLRAVQAAHKPGGKWPGQRGLQSWLNRLKEWAETDVAAFLEGR